MELHSNVKIIIGIYNNLSQIQTMIITRRERESPLEFEMAREGEERDFTGFYCSQVLWFLTNYTLREFHSVPLLTIHHIRRHVIIMSLFLCTYSISENVKHNSHNFIVLLSVSKSQTNKREYSDFYFSYYIVLMSCTQVWRLKFPVINSIVIIS